MTAGFAQEGAPGAPDLATMEAQLEEAFAEALEMSEEEPMLVLQAWGSVLMNASILERVRAMAELGGGVEPSPIDQRAAAERILERWQRARPESGGPSLFQTFEIQDPAEKRAAVIALLGRYPDDPLVLSQAVQELRSAGEAERARQVLEAFLARDPGRSLAHRLLAGNAMGNETRLAEVLERWAGAVPGDPHLVKAWLGSVLPSQEPAATERVLAGFFDRRPRGEDVLDACLEVIERGPAGFEGPARACVARVAGDRELPSYVTERATSALVGMAAADGDWAGLLGALDAVEPEARARALRSAAAQLEKPAHCADAVELLAVASEVRGDPGENLFASTAAFLKACSEVPAAQELLLDLLRRAPADEVAGVLGRWLSRVNDEWRGELPDGARELLERRLEREPEAPELHRALDIAYQLADPGKKRFDLLLRWHRTAPSSFRREEAVDLAEALVSRSQPEAAVEVLERQLETRFESEVAVTLWELYGETEDPEQAERFADELIESGDRWRQPTGHHLAARFALMREELETAEAHYWKALAAEVPSSEVAVELLMALAWGEEPARVASTAQRICEETRLGGEPPDVPGCAARLLTRAGQPEAASSALAARAAELPDDLEALRQLATTAQAAGEVETAERALRRILELDPRSDGSWAGLGRFLETQGRAEEAAGLLEESRRQFTPPPSELARAVGRAFTAAGEPRRAIETLLEARASLPDTEGGEWSRGWINQELREAYGALGKEAAAQAPSTTPPPRLAFAAGVEAPEPPEAATAAELRLAANELYAGESGRYDPEAAKELYARAASLGDPQAAFRLAVLGQLDPVAPLPAGLDPEGLFRRSEDAVREQAEGGDGYAQYLVGIAALTGLGQPVDYAAARHWLELAAAQGESWAWRNLGWMAESGFGLERPDPQAALAAYRRASEAGNTRSMVDVARLTLTWEASGAQCEEGLRWLERSAAAGNALAASFLGKLLLYGRGECVASDAETARPWLEAAYATDQPGGAYDLGLALVLSGPNATARSRGISLLERDARAPSGLGAETLAFFFATGIGVERDPAEAARWMAEAARLGSDGFPRLRETARLSEVVRALLDHGLGRLEELAGVGDPPAAALLVRLHALGLARTGQRIDPRATVGLAREAAAAGEALAMRVLADAYRLGEGVGPDPAEAHRWRRRCAEAGDSFCMMFYGQDLRKGEGVDRDVREALVWLRRAAEAGNWWAISDLGNLYDEAWDGLPRDPAEAAAWKRRLAELGDPEAKGWLLYHGYP